MIFFEVIGGMEVINAGSFCYNIQELTSFEKRLARHCDQEMQLIRAEALLSNAESKIDTRQLDERIAIASERMVRTGRAHVLKQVKRLYDIHKQNAAHMACKQLQSDCESRWIKALQ